MLRYVKKDLVMSAKVYGGESIVKLEFNSTNSRTDSLKKNDSRNDMTSMVTQIISPRILILVDNFL